MAEFGQLKELLDVDYVVPHEIAGILSGIGHKLKSEYPDFIALHVGGSTVCGGVVAKSLVLNIEPEKAISDIDYGVLLSRQFSLPHRKLLHMNITHKLEEVGLKPCWAFNAKNVYLIADDPFNMAQRMLVTKQEKPVEAASYLATYLLMPYGVIFPTSGRLLLQEMVEASLVELATVDSPFAEEIGRAHV